MDKIHQGNTVLTLTADKKVMSDSRENKEVSKEDILQVVFSEPVGSIDSWTLRDLMLLIEPYGMILGEMALCRFDKFIEEMRKPAEPDDFVNKIEYIMVARSVSLHEGQINEYCDVYGGNDTITDEQIRADFEANGVTDLSNRYAIGLTPINLLADKPLRIDDSFVVREELIESSNPEKEVFKARKPLYLLDIIWAILWEISFYGGPEKRDEFSEELDRRMKSIEDGTAELIPAEEVFERLRGKLATQGESGGMADAPDLKSVGPQGP